MSVIAKCYCYCSNRIKQPCNKDRQLKTEVLELEIIKSSCANIIRTFNVNIFVGLTSLIIFSQALIVFDM